MVRSARASATRSGVVILGSRSEPAVEEGPVSDAPSPQKTPVEPRELDREWRELREPLLPGLGAFRMVTRTQRVREVYCLLEFTRKK